MEISGQSTPISFTVRSNGPAIPVENQQRQFEHLFCSDEAHNRQTDSFGLGLNIVTELARTN